MATTPGSPVMQGLKNFWQRPEGTVGKVVLVLGGIAAAYGFVQILPFLIAAATDTLHLALLIGAILVFLFIVMDKQLGNLNGSIRTLQNQIDTNQKDAEHSMALANQADKKMAAGGLTSLDQQQYMSAKVTNQRHAASLININKSLTDLRDKLKIIYDQTLEYLADDAGQMLGEMEDFNRLANKLMTNMDLETGAINEDAVKQLSEFQQKLLPASVTAVPGGVPEQSSAVPANKKDDYSDLIK